MADKNMEFVVKPRTPKEKIQILRVIGISDADPKTRDGLSIWDKRKWLVLEDYWLDRISQERADEMLKEIITKEKGGGN